MIGLNQVLLKAGIAGLTAMSSIVTVITVAQAQNLSVQAQHDVYVAQTSNKSSTQSATIAGIASSSESFRTLTAALTAADLVEVLNGETVYTVFAPTDDAFAALPEGTVETLLQPENRDQLIRVLTYHVVPGRVMSTDLSDGSVTSAEGSSLEVLLGEASVSINEATVTQADIEASNGVIHVIDKVLLPPNLL
ncbi:MAG: fasciclin domain-containing protein [Cyanobacteria bacterium P01_A01_bin.37]